MEHGEIVEREGILLSVAYDGAAFAGWARQPAQRTVQGTLEGAIEAMNGAPCELRGTSRTDAGVHALAQCAAFDPDRAIEARGWLRGLNRTLPDDIVVQSARACPRGYTPRFDAVEKTYRYVLLVTDEVDPLERGRAWFVAPRLQREPREGAPARDRLDVAAMETVARAFTGTHDFRAFRQADDDREQTTRTIHELRVELDHQGDPRRIALFVRGDAFMKNMVRILAGTLVDVGRGRLTIERAIALLTPGERKDAGPTAPAHGLTLMSIVLGRGERGASLTPRLPPV